MGLDGGGLSSLCLSVASRSWLGGLDALEVKVPVDQYLALGFWFRNS